MLSAEIFSYFKSSLCKKKVQLNKNLSSLNKEKANAR